MTEQNAQPLMLVVDDDATFSAVLSRALARRGFEVMTAESAEAAVRSAARRSPDFVVVDLKLPGASGLSVVSALKTKNPAARVVVLTGYASIATAVEAIKLGALYYLAKPVTADDIMAAFERREGDPNAAAPLQPLSVERLTWEHIQKVLSENEGNVSATARSLGMHRRTLQRKLSKRPARR
jgi:two-component system, response regulator RegA